MVKIKDLEVHFEYHSETKNNFIFAQEKSTGSPDMYPPKIYLSKELFNNKAPSGVIVLFKVS